MDACTKLHHDKGRLQRELKYFKSQAMQKKAFITYDNKPTPSTRSMAIVITRMYHSISVRLNFTFLVSVPVQQTRIPWRPPE